MQRMRVLVRLIMLLSCLNLRRVSHSDAPKPAGEGARFVTGPSILNHRGGGNRSALEQTGQTGGSGKEVNFLSKVSNKAISDYLSKEGILHANQGYRFLMLGIRAILDGEVDRYCIRAVYDYVAMQSNITSGQVDRAIRQSIRRTEHPVPNKEFLLRAADELALTADANAFIFETANNPTGQ